MNRSEIKLVLLDVKQEFNPTQTEDGEWATEYNVYLGDSLSKRFDIKSLRRVPEPIGYNFWLLVRSPGYCKITDDIDESAIKNAFVSNVNDPEAVYAYVQSRVNTIGKGDWGTLEKKLGAFLDISDVEDDARQDTKGNA